MASEMICEKINEVQSHCHSVGYINPTASTIVVVFFVVCLIISIVLIIMLFLQD